ncbi:MAG: general secretion pathway protein GspK, partial [Planctomycetaceae bacterium]|nr:general secretion pathway protein GspK [Planctomycetaceae bacterium]
MNVVRMTSKPSQTASPNRPRKGPLQPAAGARGFVLIVVLVTVVLLSISAYTFSLLMLYEQKATKLMGRQLQSRYLVESGVDFLRLYLSVDEATLYEIGGVWDNADQFTNQIVSVNPLRPTEIGRFSIIASNLDDEGNPVSFRAGITDESSRLNLNTLTNADTWLPDSGDGNGGGGRQLLMALPQMTEDVADAILDWLDEDSDPRDYGVEDYSSQSPPYACKNGPMDSIEELLLVRGVTPQLLFGLDANHNGIVDLDEQYAADGTTSYEPEMQLGWANYLTLFSKESNLNGEGLQRIYLNSDDLEQLYDELRSSFSEEWSNFIIAYRVNGPADGSVETSADQPNYLEADPTQQASFTFSQILDLVDAQTTLEFTDEEGETQTALLQSPVNSGNLAQTLPLLMENLTTVDSDNIPGRINIMQAPRAILAGIPGMTDDILQGILDYREFELNDPGLTDLNKKYETWIMLPPTPLVDLETMKTMMPFICCGGDVYRAEIVGYFDDNVATSRAEVILDTTEPLPRILFWRDKSHLQRGYSVESLG